MDDDLVKESPDYLDESERAVAGLFQSRRPIDDYREQVKLIQHRGVLRQLYMLRDLIQSDNATGELVDVNDLTPLFLEEYPQMVRRLSEVLNGPGSHAFDERAFRHGFPITGTSKTGFRVYFVEQQFVSIPAMTEAFFQCQKHLLYPLFCQPSF